MSGDAASGLPPFGAPPDHEDPAEDVLEGDPWGADPDAMTANWFSDEIENVSASDWDVDAEQIWGDDDTGAAADDAGGAGLDFSL
jgi:hypothetical protein